MPNPDHTPQNGRPKFSAYVICTSPRSGSTLLCQLLSDSGVAGRPASYFHTPDVERWAQAFGLSADPQMPQRNRLEQIMQAALVKGRAGTDVFGLRLQAHSLAYFRRQLTLLTPDTRSDAERIQTIFGRPLFIHLTREDKVAQAVSYLMAQQTGLWHRASDGTEIERQSPHCDPSYDEDAIRACVARFFDDDSAWVNYLETQNISPIRVTYAELSDDPIAILRRILQALGQDSDRANTVTPSVAKLANHTSAAWIAQYKATL